MIDKGDCVSKIAEQVLLEAHGCYDKKPFLGALGGMIQQWYYVITAINQLYPDEDLHEFFQKTQKEPATGKKATTPKQLIMD